MYLLLIAAIILAFAFPAGRAPLSGPFLTPFAAVSISLLTALFGYFLLPLARKCRAGGRNRDLAVLGIMFLVWRLLLLIGFACAVFLFGWTEFVFSLVTLCEIPLAGELALLLPFLVSALLSFIPQRRLELTLRPVRWGLLSYATFHVRHDLLLVLVPWVVYVAVFDLVQVLFPSGLAPAWELALAFLLLVCMFLFAPVGLRYIFSTQPFPEGLLLERLNAFAMKVGFKVSRILVWKTAPAYLANACVIGIKSGLRYVFLSDGLLAMLSPDEIEAVVAHEAAHIKRCHFAVYFAFSVAFIFVALAASAVYERLRPGDRPDWESGLLLVAVALVYWGGLFGFASRRLERDADVWAARVIGGAGPVVSSLGKIGASNSLRGGRSWRHFSIEKRVADLKRFEQEKSLVAGWNRQIVATLLGLGVLAALSVWVLLIL